MRNEIARAGLLATAIVALVACSSSGGSAAPASAGSSAAAPSVAASVAAPSEAVASTAPSEAAPSEAAPSLAIPSFSFPSTDKELEALLPAELCGAKVQKLSLGGEMFDSAADPSFVAMLQKLGKTTKDVSFAIAAPLQADSACTAGIFRIKGADSGALKDAFLAEAQKAGNTFTVKNIGGKDVYVDPTSDSFGYAYFKGDALIFAGAKDEGDAATIIAVLP